MSRLADTLRSCMKGDRVRVTRELLEALAEDGRCSECAHERNARAWADERDDMRRQRDEARAQLAALREAVREVLSEPHAYIGGRERSVLTCALGAAAASAAGARPAGEADEPEPARAAPSEGGGSDAAAVRRRRAMNEPTQMDDDAALRSALQRVSTPTSARLAAACDDARAFLAQVRR